MEENKTPDETSSAEEENSVEPADNADQQASEESQDSKEQERESLVLGQQINPQDDDQERSAADGASTSLEDAELAHGEFVEIFAGEADLRSREEDQTDSELKAAATDQIDDDVKTEETSQALGLSFNEELTLEGKIEAVLFASPKPLKAADILELVQDDEETVTAFEVDAVLQQLVSLYKERSGGFRLEVLKSQGYQFQTVAAASPLMERLFSNRPRPLSRAALETLSIIAYRQPATRADIEFVRGVDAGSIIKNLLDRELIRCVGRKEDAGRPMIFGTTDEFLKVFGLKELKDLPPLSAFQPEGEVVEQAIQKMNDGEQAVDVEEFVGDEDQEKPEVSQGVESESAELTGQNDAELIVEEDSNEETEAAQGREIEGASVVGDENDQETEVVSPEEEDSDDFEIQFDDDGDDETL